MIPLNILASGMLLVAGTVWYGLWRPAQIQAQGEVSTIRCMAVAPNLSSPGSTEAMFHWLHRLHNETEKALDQHPETDLVVWPETALWFPLDSRLVKPTIQQVTEQKRALITGCVAAGQSQKLNSLTLVDRDGLVVGGYQKVFLLPFVEYIPAGWRWFVDHAISPTKRSEWQPGTIHASLSLPSNPKFRIIPLICYEDCDFESARAAWNPSFPNLIVDIANDAAFANDENGPAQHLANAVFRSIELRCPMVRCANKGFSCVIAGDAKFDFSKILTRQTPVFDTVVLARPTITIFAMWGYLLPHIVFLVTVVALLWRLRPQGFITPCST